MRPAARAHPDGAEPSVWIAQGPDAAARAAGWVEALQAAGFTRLPRLEVEAPVSGPSWVAGAPADLSAVELAFHTLFSRRLLSRGDAVVLADLGDEEAAPWLAELRHQPGVRAVPDDAPTASDPLPAACLSAAEVEALARRDDPEALGRAADRAVDEGWTLRASTLLELRARRLAALGVPPEDPIWGEGAWVWWRHADTARAARELDALVPRAGEHGWPSARRLRLALGLCRLLFDDVARTAGLLERAARDAREADAHDDELLALLGLVIARDRQGIDSRGLLAEVIDRTGPTTAPWVRARALDSLGAHHHRAGRIDEAIACFRQAAEVAALARNHRLALVFEARLLDVSITSGRAEPSLEMVRALRVRVASRGSLRTAVQVLQVHGDVARRLGALDEAQEAYETLRRLVPEGPPPIGPTQLALERGDWREAARRLEEAAHAREPTGRRAREALVAQALPMYEALGDLERWEAALVSWPLSVRGGQVDVARAAEAAARLARERGDDAALTRAARAAGLAVGHWRALGREDRAAAVIAEAVAGHRRSAPIPLGPLDLIQPVARGGTCTVWRARHRELEVDVAVKVLSVGDDEAAAALDAEVRATLRLRSPYVVSVVDLGAVDDLAAALGGEPLPAGSPWVALEWVGGGSLATRRGQLSWAATRAVLGQLLEALGHAHAAGLVHRDVKPGNLMWAGEDQGLPVIRLVDFGLAGVGHDTIAGTPAYMAPEQFRGEGVGPWSDLYAVGCVAVALTQGSPPFGSPSLSELRGAHLYAPLPEIRPNVAVPEELYGWLEGLLAKDPRHRFPSAGAALAALDALGPPVWRSFAPAARAPEPSGNETMLLDALEGEAWEPDEAPPPARPTPPTTRPPAPVPPWSGRAEPPLPRPLGRALARMGTPALVGRHAQQAALWQALGEAAQGPRAVVVCGPPGVGVSALVSWLAREACAVGCAAVHDARAYPSDLGAAEQAASRGELSLVLAEEPDEAETARLAAILRPGHTALLVVAAHEPATIARWRALGASLCEVERHALHHLVIMARDLAPLRGDVSLSLAHAADGSARLLVDLVHARLGADELVPAPGGLVARANVDAQALPSACAAALLRGVDEAAQRWLRCVALLGPFASAERVRALRRALDDEDDAPPPADLLEAVGGVLRARRPGLAAAVAAGLGREALAAGADVLARASAPAARARAAGLWVRAGRVAEAIDELAQVVWDFPADVGELTIRAVVREASEALAATGASGADPRWARLNLTEARAALLALRPEDAGALLARVEALDLREARVQAPLLRAIVALHLDRAAALPQLDEALANPEISGDPALWTRYAVTRAVLARDLPALGALAPEAERLGAWRVAGDAWRELARRADDGGLDPETVALADRAIAAYERAGSPHGVWTALDCRADAHLRRGDLDAFVADVEQGAALADSSTLSALGWLHLAAARLVAGREQDAADLMAAALALGLDRGVGARRRAGLVAAALAADGPARAWLEAVALIESDPRRPSGPVPALLRGLAVARARTAGQGERAAWLESLDLG